ncbi:MAG: tRNA (adenosine(37)-N6)-dimethylallyltransferase MiaA [Clostridia bacterium]|nr:tRNA (adenosine(37)-N6)-dimethylallyltransferase MiaA [Clostridia bacterium]
MMKKKLIAVVGTNASGKSGLGIRLAKAYGGEIVSADSRQVYEGMDLGSGKVTPEEMDGVPHHLLDVVKPGEFFSMADFQRLAYEAIEDILARGRQPFLVGGTGLYVDAVTEGYVLSDRKPDPGLRAHLETYDTPALYEMLRERIPDTDVDPKNRHRVMRMLEKLEAGDEGPAPRAPRYETLKLGVTWPREILKERIDERLDRRLEQGMVEEVRAMLEAGVSEEFLTKLGLEYKYLTWYLTGKMDYDRMKGELRLAIKRFAKRQMTWFRKDPEIHWLDMAGDPLQEARELADAFLEDR